MTPAPFPRIAYEDAMLRYGTDKPDLRNPLEICGSERTCSRLRLQGVRREDRARDSPAARRGRRSRSFWDKLEEQAKNDGAAGLAWLSVEADGTLKGPVAKFLTPENAAQSLRHDASRRRATRLSPGGYRYGEDLQDSQRAARLIWASSWS